jgi:hypothetical protein
MPPTKNRQLAQRTPQRLPIAPSRCPAGFFGLRSLLESLDFSLNGGGPQRVLLLGLVQRSLRLADRLLSAFTVPLPGGFFARPFKLAAPPFPFVVEGGLPFRYLIDVAKGKLLGPMTIRLAGGFRWSTAAKMSRQFGMFAGRSIGSNRAS